MAFALADAAVSKLRLFDIDLEKAEAVSRKLSEVRPELPVVVGEIALDGVDIVANATPLGMRPDDPLPVDRELLQPTQLVTEMIMKPSVTPLLEAAR
jgi:shikimate dehydrogenase